tara:strand:- start:57 stop:740 length:684 start_codon:yes stop_codon:yes gene_type:complete
MTPTQIYEKIGKPPEGVRLKADGRGNVTTEQVSNRRARRNRANAKRSADAKLSRPTLTPKEKKDKKKLENQRTKERAEGNDTEILHKQRPSLTGPQLGRLKGEQRKKVRKKLEQAYGRLGDSPENLELGSGADNRQEQIDYEEVQRRLGQMEEQNPSKPTNPSADYAKTEENGNGANGYSYSNGNGNGNGNGDYIGAIADSAVKLGTVVVGGAIVLAELTGNLLPNP